MSSSIPKVRFLLDENVRKELFVFLQKMQISIRVVPKGASDEMVTQISRKEKRIIVTNDQDFSEYPKNTVFSVVWLKIPQNDPQSLVAMFDQLLKECKKFNGKLIVLERNTWKDWPLPVAQSA